MNPVKNYIRAVLFTVFIGVAPSAVHASFYDAGLVQYSQGQYTLAADSFLAAVEVGESGAAHMLMNMYEQGLGVKADANEAFQWTLVAAFQGVPLAQYRAAETYAARKDIPHAMDNAFYWYQKAAKQGHHGAYYRLAQFYDKGLVVEANAKEAQRLYDYAASEFDIFAQKGDSSSQNQLAGMYERGEGVNVNMLLAMSWYRKAAYAGLPEAQYHMGRMLAGVEGVRENLPESTYWLAKAAEQGFGPAAMLLAEVQEQLPSSVARR